MSDEKQSNFKVTDRRKFNPDGTVRDQDLEPPAATAEAQKSSDSLEAAPATADSGSSAIETNASGSQPATEISQPRANTDNVVSFPGQQAQASAPAGSDGPAAKVSGSSSAQTPQQKAVEEAYAKHSAKQTSEIPQATFLSIVNMLGIEAAMNLGMVQVPGHEETQIDLEAAKHMIDLLGVLQAKTRGNLTPEEDHLMENLLADLRMQFVSLSTTR